MITLNEIQFQAGCLALAIEHIESSTRVARDIVREEDHAIDAMALIVSNQWHLLAVLKSQSLD